MEAMFNDFIFWKQKIIDKISLGTERERDFFFSQWVIDGGNRGTGIVIFSSTTFWRAASIKV